MSFIEALGYGWGSQRLARTIFLSLLIPSMLVLCGCDEKSKHQLGFLHQIAIDTPLYPEFKQVSSYDNNKVGDAILVLCYNSSAQLDDVKGFYTRALSGRGWIIFTAEEREHNILHGDDLAFRRGQYMISIKQDRDSSPRCSYVITYYWEE